MSDNGVGMTEEVIKNYFTQIGKSYYRSPDFNQERAAMKAAGEVVSPICETRKANVIVSREVLCEVVEPLG